jgi:hypothetical protein
VTEDRHQLANVQVDQTGASAHGDVVAGNKVETHFHPPAAPPGVVEKLLQRLQAEVAQNEKACEIIESLAWPAPGSEDTELGVLLEPEVAHGEAEVYAGV